MGLTPTCMCDSIPTPYHHLECPKKEIVGGSKTRYMIEKGPTSQMQSSWIPRSIIREWERERERETGANGLFVPLIQLRSASHFSLGVIIGYVISPEWFSTARFCGCGGCCCCCCCCWSRSSSNDKLVLRFWTWQVGPNQNTNFLFRNLFFRPIKGLWPNFEKLALIQTTNL